MKSSEAFIVKQKNIVCPHCGLLNILLAEYSYNNNIVICEYCNKEFEVTDDTEE